MPMPLELNLRALSANNRDDSSPPVHVAWVNQHAAFVGGCEQYVYDTAVALKELGVRSSLLYDVEGDTQFEFLQGFDSAFPLVDAPLQLEQLGADVVYAHRVRDPEWASALCQSQVPCARFYHDHALFCLREHKYTTVGSQTCSRAAGLGCYACLGFLQRSASWPGVRVRTLGELQRRQAANRDWDVHVVGSDYMASQLKLHGFPEARVRVAPLYAPDVAGDAAEHTSPHRDARTIVFAGQLVRGKGVDLLLNAMCQLPDDATLVIAGEGRQGAELRALRDRLQLQPRVRFVGRLSRPELLQLYRSAAIVAMPSRSPETFGLAGLEALSCGAPVVAADVGGISMWLSHETNGLLVAPNCSQSLAKALGRLLAHERFRRQLGAQGAKDCAERFSKESHLSKLLQLFTSCLRACV